MHCKTAPSAQDPEVETVQVHYVQRYKKDDELNLRKCKTRTRSCLQNPHRTKSTTVTTVTTKIPCDVECQLSRCLDWSATWVKRMDESWGRNVQER